MESIELSSILVEFVEKNTVDGHIAPALKQVDASHWDSYGGAYDRGAAAEYAPSGQPTAPQENASPPAPPMEPLSAVRSSQPSLPDYKSSISTVADEKKSQVVAETTGSSYLRAASVKEDSEGASKQAIVIYGPVPNEPDGKLLQLI